MDLEKNETAVDLSDAENYVAIYKNKEGIHVSFHGDEMELINVITAVLLEHEYSRNIFKNIIEALDEPYEPTPPEEIN